MALGELLAVGAVQERQVGVARRLVTEGGEDEQLLRRVGEVVVAAHDLGDPHLGVVDGDREVVEDRAVAAGDDEVVVAGVGEGDRPADQVLDHGLAVVGHPQPDRRPGLLGRGRRGSRGRRRARPSRPRRPWPSPRRGRRRRTPAAARARPRGDRRARPGRAAPRPSPAPASASRRGSARRSPASSARGRCPRSAAPARRRRGAPQASCRVPSSLRRCAAHRSARGRIGDGGFR